MFVVGKADGIVYMTPPALRFWSKMGLTPRSGPKDVVVFFLYEDGSKPSGEVESWAKRVCSVYNVRLVRFHSPNELANLYLLG